MLKNFFSLFLKSNCIFCQRPADGSVCDYCQRQLQTDTSTNPTEFWQGDLPVFIWGVYEGQLKKAIAALKYDGHRPLGELMGFWLGKAFLASCLPNSLSSKMAVIPIPLHSDKLKSRGFNQAELIGRSFCQVTGYHHLPLGLTRTRNTQAMFGLNSQERVSNLIDAFEVSPLLLKRSSQPILLLDDIYTTGTTVREAAKVLRTQGLEVKGVVAIARPKKAKTS